MNPEATVFIILHKRKFFTYTGHYALFGQQNLKRHRMHTKLWCVNLLKNGHMEDKTGGRQDDITMNLGGV